MQLLYRIARKKATAPGDNRGRKLSKNLGELERAKGLSNFQSSPATCAVGAGLFYRREIPFPGEKIATLQIPRSGISKKS